jgi:hypothetical protein
MLIGVLEESRLHQSEEQQQMWLSEAQFLLQSPQQAGAIITSPYSFLFLGY